MPQAQFDRDQMAAYYARRHIDFDEGVREIYYLKQEAPDREIRFLEVNNQIAELNDTALEPIDFGVATGSDKHVLVVLDVTPSQFDRIQAGRVPLPEGWTLENSRVFPRVAR